MRHVEGTMKIIHHKTKKRRELEEYNGQGDILKTKKNKQTNIEDICLNINRNNIILTFSDKNGEPNLDFKIYYFGQSNRGEIFHNFY